MEELLGSLPLDDDDASELPDACGFSAAELDAAVKVLARCCERPSLLDAPALKELRRAGQVFVDRSKSYFAGKGTEQYAQDRFRRKAAATRRQRAKQLDRAFVNNTQLRVNRIESLARLTLGDGQPQRLLEGPAAPAGPEPAAAAEAAAAEAGPSSGSGAFIAINGRGERELEFELRSCYICKVRFTRLHEFYDRLCPQCAALNFEKRNQTADLRGRIAIVTGARVKIGFHVTLKLLRAGAHVIATTRFPHDAAVRFAKEADFEDFRSRLDVYGIDFRDLSSVCRFADFVSGRYPHLDVLVNNAAQTVRRPPSFYAHLIPAESLAPAALPDGMRATLRGQQDFVAQCRGPSHLARVTDGQAAPPAGPASAPHTAPRMSPSAALTQVALTEEDGAAAAAAEALFPPNAYDVDGQQVDLRRVNSWLLPLEKVPPVEAVETHAVNALAPFLLSGRLKPLLLKSPHRPRFVVNVSAMEGKFYRYKTPNHPHTNMAKAALNMMTRTSAEDFARDAILMNSVDTGWINDENPAEVAARTAARHDFQTPIDEVDAAARILDPVFSGVREGAPPLFGQFLKDYFPTEW